MKYYAFFDRWLHLEQHSGSIELFTLFHSCDIITRFKDYRLAVCSWHEIKAAPRRENVFIHCGCCTQTKHRYILLLHTVDTTDRMSNWTKSEYYATSTGITPFFGTQSKTKQRHTKEGIPMSYFIYIQYPLTINQNRISFS